MEVNEKLTILTNAVNSLMESNKALTEQVKDLHSAAKTDESKKAKDKVLDDIMSHL